MLPMQVALFIGNYASLEILSESLLAAILVWLSRRASLNVPGRTFNPQTVIECTLLEYCALPVLLKCRQTLAEPLKVL